MIILHAISLCRCKFKIKMKSYRFCLFLVIYTLMVLILLDCDHIGSSAQANIKKSKISKSSTSSDSDSSSKKKSTSSDKPVPCPKDRVHSEEFQMKMALCRPNISIICTAKPNSVCFNKGAKIKATAFVHKRNGQCLLESNVTAYKTLRFHVEAKRVLNPNAEGSRSIGAQQSHQRGKCLLKYVCDERYLRTITMECGSVFADEKGTLSNFTRQRSFWAAPPKFTDFVHFFADMSVSSDKRELNISSAKLFAPGMEQVEKTTKPSITSTTTIEPTTVKSTVAPTTGKTKAAKTTVAPATGKTKITTVKPVKTQAGKKSTTTTTTTKKPEKEESDSDESDDDDD